MRTLFDNKENAVLVKVLLTHRNYQAYNIMALDTGASRSIISQETARLLGFGNLKPTIKIVTGSGIEKCAIVNVQRTKALGKSVRNLEVICHDLPPDAGVDGLLGLDFLRRFDLRFNFKKGWIELK